MSTLQVTTIQFEDSGNSNIYYAGNTIATRIDGVEKIRVDGAGLKVGTNVVVNNSTLTMNNWVRVNTDFVSIGNSSVGNSANLTNEKLVMRGSSTQNTQISSVGITGADGNSSFTTYVYGTYTESEVKYTQNNYDYIDNKIWSNSTSGGIRARYWDDSAVQFTSNGELSINSTTAFLSLRGQTDVSVTANSTMVSVGDGAVNVYVNSTAFVGNVVTTSVIANLTGNVVATTINATTINTTTINATTFQVGPNFTANSTQVVAPDVLITGNLIVNGTTVSVNTSILDIADLNITLAKGTVSASLANGAGITVDGANAKLTYIEPSNTWLSNINFTVGNGSANVSVNSTTFIGNVAATRMTGNLTGNVLATTINATGNVSISSVFNANGGAGSAGQLLTSAGSGSPAYWANVPPADMSVTYTWTNNHYYAVKGADIATINSTGIYLGPLSFVSGMRKNKRTIDNNLTIYDGDNASLVGPIIISSGVTLTLEANTRFFIS